MMSVRMVLFHLPAVLKSISNRRVLFVCTATLFAIVLIDQFFNDTSKFEGRPCNSTCIQRHYMNHLSVYALLQTKPVRHNVFAYEITNENVCQTANEQIDLLVFITSTSNSYERRRAIRRTYGKMDNVLKYIRDTSSRLIVRVLFMLDVDEGRIKNIASEGRIFDDIVQVKIPEHYSMSTYRDLAILDWSSKYCAHARFIFKTDDQSFINPFLLLKFINEHPNDRFHRTLPPPLDIERGCSTIDARIPILNGFIRSHEQVIRKQTNRIPYSERYIVGEDEYPYNIYPDHLDDHAYFISSDARNLILCTFYRQSTSLLPISNVYITGFLPEYLNIDRHPLLDYQLNTDSTMACEEFFRIHYSARAFACVVDDIEEAHIFERYYTYWQILIKAQRKSRLE